jgi:hypothetical protein
MLSNMNRRKFLKLTGTMVLATSVAGALGGCSGGGSSTPAPPSPEEEGIAQIILDSINAARKEVGLDGTVQEVDKISQLSAQRAGNDERKKARRAFTSSAGVQRRRKGLQVWRKRKLDSNGISARALYEKSTDRRLPKQFSNGTEYTRQDDDSGRCICRNRRTGTG